MKKILFFFLLLCPFLMNAQDLVNFKLTPQGSFVAADGENYVVVPFEGKTAHQLYQMLASNVGSVYNDPSKVMTGVEDASIKIRAFSDNIYVKKVLGMPSYVQGHYQLEFRIKDGRVRVSAPMVEENLEMVGADGKRYPASFSHIVKGWFKNGEPKEKEVQNIENVENQMNYPINAILGLVGKTSTVDEDW